MRIAVLYRMSSGSCVYNHYLSDYNTFYGIQLYTILLEISIAIHSLHVFFFLSVVHMRRIVTSFELAKSMGVGVVNGLELDRISSPRASEYLIKF